MAEQCGTGEGVTHYAGCACHEQGWQNKWECAVEMAAQAQGERDRLLEVMRAAMVLIAAKGRHNTFLAYQGLKDAVEQIDDEPEHAPMEDRWDYDHGPDHIREVIEG